MVAELPLAAVTCMVSLDIARFGFVPPPSRGTKADEKSCVLNLIPLTYGLLEVLEDFMVDKILGFFRLNIKLCGRDCG